MEDRHEEYPPLDGIGEDYKSLRIVSPAYAGRKGELTAVLQYVYQSILLGELGKKEMSSAVFKIAVNEMRHLELLGTVITKLGAPPAFTACPPYPVGYFSASNVNYAKSPCEMIQADIAAEEDAICDYRQMIARLSNPPLTALIERIAKDEEAHLAAFKEMKRELEKEKRHS